MKQKQIKLMILVFTVLVITLPSLPLISSQHSPAAIAGFVLDASGLPVPDGTTVTVTNENTGVSTTTTTGLGTGMYATAITASDGDIINASASVGAQTGRNSTFVDLSLVTNWINLTLGNMPPTACFTYIPQHPFVDELVTFVDCSTDAGGRIVSWDWVYGDGERYTRRDASHVYKRNGTYRVTLMVTDNDGQTDTARDYIQIGEDVPHIPPPQPPEYRGYTVPEMYSLLRVSDLPDSDGAVTIVFMDSGVLPQIYNEIDLSLIEMKHHISYPSGIDMYGHGTFIGYELAYLVQTKMPNSQLISYRVFDGRGKSTRAVFLTALDEVKELHPDIVTISGGITGNPTDAFSKKIEELRNSGIIVFCAAGNNGPRASTILSPACSDSAIAVGASKPGEWAENYTERWNIILDLSDDEVTRWSSRGPVTGISPKPDVSAPGESVIGPWLGEPSVKSGTSMSVPLICSASALILANNKGLVDFVRTIYFWDGATIPNIFESALKESCYQPDRYSVDGVDVWGAGIPVFTKVNEIFFWNLIMLLIIPVIIICVIVAFATIFVLRRLKKKRKSNVLH